ncbi:MAG: glycosyltransferase family 2 protein [Actinomycetota bacterium]|nr:glycosyltransferase family 2 protein [Actinomycetota bacterium]
MIAPAPEHSNRPGMAFRISARRDPRPDPRDLALTIVIPAFNEEARLDDSLPLLTVGAATGAIDPATTEIIVVDDGSTDCTAERALALLRRFPHSRAVRLHRNVGKGGAVRAGVAQVRSPVSVFMDSDMSVDPSQLPQLLAALEQADVAIGSRALPTSTVICDNFGRIIMGRMFNRVVNAATKLSLEDTQCGFKAFRTPIARLLFQFTRTERFAFDVDLLVLARRLGLRIAEVPVFWRHVGGSRVRMLRDPLSMLSDVMSIKVDSHSTQSTGGLVVMSDEAKQDLVPAIQAVLDENYQYVPGRSPLICTLEGGGALVLFPMTPESEAWEFAECLTTRFPQFRVSYQRFGIEDLARHELWSASSSCGHSTSFRANAVDASARALNRPMSSSPGGQIASSITPLVT